MLKKELLYGLLAIFLVSFHGLKAQEGNFFLTHYTPAGKSFDNINFDIVQDYQGMICIANRSGVVRFDGKNWDFIKTPSAIFSLAIDDNNVIYTGGQAGFGRLTRDENFSFQYIPLSDHLKNATGIFRIAIKENVLYAINSQHVFIYDIMDKSSQMISSRYSGEMKELVKYNDNIYVITSRSGLQEVSAGKLLTPKNLSIASLDVKLIAPGPHKNEYLLGTDHEYYISRNGKLTPVPLKDDDAYLKDSDPQAALWLSDSLAAISTLKGGVIFINPLNGDIVKTINHQSGLPDNQIFAISTDENQGVWAAHSRGLTRISPRMPFKSFNLYPGLNGKILSAKSHQGKLYVGTSLGAYSLDEIKNYKEVITYSKVANPEKTETQKEEAGEEAKRKGGLFAFLKKRRKEEVVKKAEQNPAHSRTASVYTKNIDKELKSTKYVYKKIEGIESKTFQFDTDGSRLFCAGLDGLFELNNGKANKITAAPIKYFFISKSAKKIFASTFNGELKVFNYGGNKISAVNVFDDFRDDIHYIFEDHKNRIWFCSIDELYWVKMDRDEIIGMDEYPLENPYYYETYGVVHKDSLLFINKTGIYTLDENDQHLVLIKNGADIHRYLSGNDNVWMQTGLTWKALAGNLASHKLNLLSVFKDITYISADENGKNYWVITDHDDLYKVSSQESRLANKSYKLFLKGIRTNSNVIAPGPELKFEQQNSQLMFEFIQPEYSGILDIQYQYKLEGLNKDWSEWSSGYNVIDFPYLPEGDYKLFVRSKNLFGAINNTEAISFEIVPPYWKQPWFYVFEFSALSFLLFISIRLKKLGYKYRLLSRLLALLTLIIIIEFIQTTAESEFTLSSPVIDFVIQVIIAIIILPVEGILRKYIFREKDVRVMDFMSLKSKKG